MSDTLTIGGVRYLNAWPLTYGLDAAPGVVLRTEVPADLPDLLRHGKVDAALLPSVEYFRLQAGFGERARARAGGPEPRRFVALPVAAITSRGSVGSVRLFGYVEREKVRRVLLDPASRTSNALAQVLCEKLWKIRPHFAFPEASGEEPARRPDAEIVIGDRGLVAERDGVVWEADLGKAWHRLIHKPFVYAFWVARADTDLARLAEVLATARDRGLSARGELAEKARAERGIPADLARKHLERQIHYTFDGAARKGLEVFRGMCEELGLVPEGVRLRLPAGPGSE